MGLRAWLGLSRPVPDTVTTPEQAPAGLPDVDTLVRSLDAIEADAIAQRLPGAALSRLQRLLQTLRNTLPRLDRLGVGSEQGYRLIATTTDYLPGAVNAFTRLPRDWATSRPVDDRGRTALMVLVDQLDLLQVNADQAYDAVCRADAQALIRHGSFVVEALGGDPA